MNVLANNVITIRMMNNTVLRQSIPYDSGLVASGCIVSIVTIENDSTVIGIEAYSTINLSGSTTTPCDAYIQALKIK
jgi:hypothetical protein